MNYTIKDDVIVFYCYLNSELTTEHNKEISKCKTLMFSNFKDIDRVISEYNYTIYNNYYNKPLNNLPQYIISLSFDSKFNKKLYNLPNSSIKLLFFSHKKINSLPKNIKIIYSDFLNYYKDWLNTHSLK